MASRLIERADLLADHPAGRPVPEFDDPVSREPIEPPYRIIYR